MSRASQRNTLLKYHCCGPYGAIQLEKISKKTHFGSFSLEPRSFWVDFWANWHPKQFHIVYLGGVHPYLTLGPLNRPLLHSRAPKRARFSPQRPFWGPQRSSEGPRGPNSVPTASVWSDWAGIMVIRHYDLVSGQCGKVARIFCDLGHILRVVSCFGQLNRI